MASYATLTDVYRLALTAQAFVTRPRALDARAGDALAPSSGVFRMIAHGLAPDDRVQLVLLGAGAIPTGGTVNTPYVPTALDFYRFTLAPVGGVTALTFADAGSGAWAIQVDPEARILAHVAQASADIDQDLTADFPPLKVDPITGLYPPVIVGIVARMAARAAVTSLQIENAAFRVPVDRLFAQEDHDNKQRDLWRSGQPINPRGTDQDNVPNNAAIAASDRPSAGWATGCL